MPLGITRAEDEREATGKILGEPGWMDQILKKIPVIGDKLAEAGGITMMSSILTGSLQNHFLFFVINETGEDLNLAWNTVLVGKCGHDIDPVIPNGMQAHWISYKEPNGLGGNDMIVIYKGAQSGIYLGFRAGQRMYSERIGVFCHTNKNLEHVKAKLINDWGEGGRDGGTMNIRYPYNGKYVYIRGMCEPNTDDALRHCYFFCKRVN